MQNFLFVIGMHLLPLFLIIIPFLLFFDISLKKSKKTPPPTPQKNLQELEENLQTLINENTTNTKIHQLSYELKQTNPKAPHHKTIKKLKTHHFFQHIFSLIKNHTKDEKIIKILRSYFPSFSTNHLYGMLKSFKIYLNLIKTTPQKSRLESSLNQNDLTPTLLFLEKRLTTLLTTLNQNHPQSSPKINNLATIYCLVFASFSEFYSKELSTHILKLATTLSPQLLNRWYTPPSKNNIKTNTNPKKPIFYQKK